MDKTKTRAEPDIPASIIESGIADAPLTNLVEVAMRRLSAARTMVMGTRMVRFIERICQSRDVLAP